MLSLANSIYFEYENKWHLMYYFYLVHFGELVCASFLWTFEFDLVGYIWNKLLLSLSEMLEEILQHFRLDTMWLSLNNWCDTKYAVKINNITWKFAVKPFC